MRLRLHVAVAFVAFKAAQELVSVVPLGYVVLRVSVGRTAVKSEGSAALSYASRSQTTTPNRLGAVMLAYVDG